MSTENLAHALRTPLSVIQSTSEALIAGGQTPEVQEGLETIINQVERMSEIVRDLAH